MANALVVVFSGPSDPSREQEYNEWYDTAHAVDSLRIPGVISCRRLKLSESQIIPPSDPSPYLTVYEVEPDAVASVCQAMKNGIANGTICTSDVLAFGSMGFWEPQSEPTL